MTQADWRSVHCDGDSECHVMKTKALAPELQVFCGLLSVDRGWRRREKRALRRAGDDEADMMRVAVAGATLACRAHGTAGQRKCPALSDHSKLSVMVQG